MTYKDALELSIEHFSKRIAELGDDALRIYEEDGRNEEWAALRSAQGGYMEALDFIEQSYAIAKSFEIEREVEDWPEMAVACINRGIDLMTTEQVGKWEGVRGVLELAPIASANAEVHPANFHAAGGRTDHAVKATGRKTTAPSHYSANS